MAKTRKVPKSTPAKPTPTCALVYVTLPHKAKVRALAQLLLQEKLAACINIFKPVTSYYIWEGKLTQSKEIVLLAKTQQALTSRLLARLKELHPYTCPALLSWQLAAVDPSFRQFIVKNTERRRAKIN